MSGLAAAAGGAARSRHSAGLVLCGLQSAPSRAQHILIKFSPDKTDSNWLGIKCLATNELRSYLSLSTTDFTSQHCFVIQTNSSQADKKCDKVIKIMSVQPVSFVFQSGEAISLREGSNP